MFAFHVRWLALLIAGLVGALIAAIGDHLWFAILLVLAVVATVITAARRLIRAFDGSMADVWMALRVLFLWQRCCTQAGFTARGSDSRKQAPAVRGFSVTALGIELNLGGVRGPMTNARALRELASKLDLDRIVPLTSRSVECVWRKPNAAPRASKV